MKSATMIVSLLLLLVFAPAMLGQSVSEKEQKKIEKEREKAEKKAFKAELAKRTVDFVQLTKFPGTFLDRPLRLERIVIKDIQGRSGDGMTGYFIALEKEYDSTMTFPVADNIFFVSDESIAKNVVTHIDGMRKGGVWPRDFNPVADVFFEVKKIEYGGQNYFAAKVSCVGIYGFLSKITWYGNCSVN